MVRDDLRRLAAPAESIGDSPSFIVEPITCASPRPAVSVERQDSAGEGVADGVQPPHGFDPSSDGHGRRLGDLVDHIPVLGEAGFFVVLERDHSLSLECPGVCSAVYGEHPMSGMSGLRPQSGMSGRAAW